MTEDKKRVKQNTTIKIDEATKAALQELKLTKEEPYYKVIKRIIEKCSDKNKSRNHNE